MTATTSELNRALLTVRLLACVPPRCLLACVRACAGAAAVVKANGAGCMLKSWWCAHALLGSGCYNMVSWEVALFSLGMAWASPDDGRVDLREGGEWSMCTFACARRFTVPPERARARGRARDVIRLSVINDLARIPDVTWR